MQNLQPVTIKVSNSILSKDSSLPYFTLPSGWTGYLHLSSTEVVQ